MHRIFLSYSRRDTELATVLADALEKDGFDVWRDTKLVAGESFSNAIFENLSSSTAVVLLISGNSQKSDYFRTEAEEAIRLGKTIIPILVGGSEAKRNFVWPLVADRNAIIFPSNPSITDINGAAEDIWYVVKQVLQTKSQNSQHFQQREKPPLFRAVIEKIASLFTR